MTKKYLDKSKNIHLIAAKRETNKFLNENFSVYLESQLRQNHNSSLEVIIKYPSQEKSLRLVDFVCWAIFGKYELKDREYYDIIKGKIKEERGLFS